LTFETKKTWAISAPCLFDYKEAQMKTHTFRLKPGQDLFDSIETFVSNKKIEAGCVLS